MRATLTSIVAILGFCAISNLALGQSVEPQLEAPEPDITTFDAGEIYSTTSDTKNDIDMRIADGGVLINGDGYTMYNNAVGTLYNDTGGTIKNLGTIINDIGGTIKNLGTIEESGAINNRGTLVNSGVISSQLYNSWYLGTITNSGTIHSSNIYNDGTLINSGTMTSELLYMYGGSTLINDGTMTNKYVIMEQTSMMTNNGTLTNTFNVVNQGTLYNNGTLYNDAEMNTTDTMVNDGFWHNRAGAILRYNVMLDNRGILYNDGTLRLTASDSRALNSGELLRNNGLIYSEVNVNAGGVLTGSGTIDGSVMLEGAINPGNSPGTITTGSQTWIDGASYGWEVNDSDGTQGGLVGWDLIEITATMEENGSLDLSNLTTGGFGIDIISLDALNDLGIAEGFDDPNAEYEFVILTTVGGITGFDAENFAINDAGFQNSGTWDWSIEQDGNNLVLSATGYTLVPEPSSTALLALGGLAMMMRRKPLR
jgi:subtilase-type serine protease